MTGGWGRGLASSLNLNGQLGVSSVTASKSHLLPLLDNPDSQLGKLLWLSFKTSRIKLQFPLRQG